MSKAGLGPEIKNLAGGLKFPADGPLNDFTSRLIKDGTLIDEICSKTQGFDRPDISDKAFKEVHGPEINSLVQQLVGRWRQTSLTALYHLARANANNSQSAAPPPPPPPPGGGHEGPPPPPPAAACDGRCRGDLRLLRHRLKDAEKLLEAAATSNVLLRRMVAQLEDPGDAAVRAWWDRLREVSDDETSTNYTTDGRPSPKSRDPSPKTEKTNGHHSPGRIEEIVNKRALEILSGATPSPKRTDSAFQKRIQESPTVNTKMQFLFSPESKISNKASKDMSTNKAKAMRQDIIEQKSAHDVPIKKNEGSKPPPVTGDVKEKTRPIEPETPLRQKIESLKRTKTSETLGDGDTSDVVSVNSDDLNNMDDNWQPKRRASGEKETSARRPDAPGGGGGGGGRPALSSSGGAPPLARAGSGRRRHRRGSGGPASPRAWSGAVAAAGGGSGRRASGGGGGGGGERRRRAPALSAPEGRRVPPGGGGGGGEEEEEGRGAEQRAAAAGAGARARGRSGSSRRRRGGGGGGREGGGGGGGGGGARGEREVSRELDETAARTLRRMAAFARSGGADFSRLLEDESKQLLSPDNLHELMKSIGFEMTLLETLALCGYLATSSNKGLLSLRVLVDKIDRQVGSMSRRNLRHSSSKKMMKREHSTRESGRRLQKTQEDEEEQDLGSPYHMKQKTPPRSSRVEANFEVDTDQTPYIKRSQSGRVPKEVEEIFAMVAARVAAGECADPLGSLRQADFYGDGAVAVHDVAAALQKFGVHVTSAEGYLVGKHLSHTQKDGLVSLSSMKRMIEKQLSKLSRSKSASRSGKDLKKMELKKKDIN